LVIAVTAVLLAVQLRPEKESRPVAWRDLSPQVGTLTLDHSQRRLFREPAKLATFLRVSHAERAAPKVDFSANQLLLISPGPRSSTGHHVEIISVRERDGKITVRVREKTPALAERVDPRVTSPYRLLSLPAGNDVYVDWVGR
jgi:hypothetical protein